MSGNKKTIGSGIHIYPLPTVIVGSKTEGKPNFITVAYVGVIESNPARIGISLGKAHYSNQGIKESKSFSINHPPAGMAEITDQIGLKSGRVFDKAQLFDVFYGELKNAPMINDVPLCMECKLIDVIDLKGTNELFIGEVVQTYADEKIIDANGLPDPEKLDPLMFAPNNNHYFGLGKKIGKAWEIGHNKG